MASKHNDKSAVPVMSRELFLSIVTEKDAAIAALTANVTVLKRRIEEMQSQQTRLETKQKELQSKNDTLDTQVRTLQQRVTTVESERDDAVKSAKEGQAHSRQLETELERTKLLAGIRSAPKAAAPAPMPEVVTKQEDRRTWMGNAVAWQSHPQFSPSSFTLADSNLPSISISAAELADITLDTTSAVDNMEIPALQGTIREAFVSRRHIVDRSPRTLRDTAQRTPSTHLPVARAYPSTSSSRDMGTPSRPSYTPTVPSHVPLSMATSRPGYAPTLHAASPYATNAVREDAMLHAQYRDRTEKATQAGELIRHRLEEDLTRIQQSPLQVSPPKVAESVSAPRGPPPPTSSSLPMPAAPSNTALGSRLAASTKDLNDFATGQALMRLQQGVSNLGSKLVNLQR